MARDPSARRYFEDDPADQAPDPIWRAELDAMPPELPDRIWLETDRPLHERDPQTFTDAEALSRLVEVEAGIARSHALRAQLAQLHSSRLFLALHDHNGSLQAVASHSQLRRAARRRRRKRTRRHQEMTPNPNRPGPDMSDGPTHPEQHDPGPLEPDSSDGPRLRSPATSHLRRHRPPPPWPDGETSLCKAIRC